jgi:hypothetical protein
MITGRKLYIRIQTKKAITFEEIRLRFSSSPRIKEDPNFPREIQSQAEFEWALRQGRLRPCRGAFSLRDPMPPARGKLQ